MLSGITIRGFQSHVETHIPLVAGLNVITGPSDSGKTSLIRTVRWVAFNEPTGEAYVNKKVGEAEATLHLADGVDITKHRRKGKTAYHLSTIPEPFEKSEVPLEVTQALGITKQTFGDFTTALNFSYQLEAPFLISETASAGAKVLGKLSGTEAVDLAIKDVSKETYAARQERLQAEKDVEKVDAQLSEFMDLQQQREQLEQSGKLLEQCTEAVQRLSQLKQLALKYEDTTNRLSRYSEEVHRLKNVTALLDLVRQFDVQVQRLQTLKRVNGSYQEVNNRLTDANAQLQKLADVPQAADTMESVALTLETYRKLSRLHDGHRTVTTSLKNAQETLQPLENVEALSLDLAKLERSYEQFKALRLLDLKHAQHLGVYNQYSKQAADIDVDGLQERLGKVEQSSKQLQELRDLYRAYLQKRTAASQAAENVTTLTRTHEEAKTALAESWGDLEVCPLCEQPTKNH